MGKRRLFWAVAAGAILGYLLVQQRKKEISPEKVITSLKERYRERFSVLGSWIYVEPQTEEINGFPCRIYRCGLTGWKDGKPHHLQFKVDAYTGRVLSVSR